MRSAASSPMTTTDSTRPGIPSSTRVPHNAAPDASHRLLAPGAGRLWGHGHGGVIKAVAVGAMLVVGGLLGACQDGDEPGPTPVDGAAQPTAQDAAASTAGEAGAEAPGQATVEAAAPVELASPEPTVSDSAAKATEIALRDQPRYLRSIGNNSFGDGTFQLPSAIAMDDAGQLYVLDTTGVQVFDREGAAVGRFGDASIAGAQSLAVSPDGSRVYVGVRPGPGATGAEGVTIVSLDANGQSISTIGQAGSEPGQLGSPAALAVDANGSLYVADSTNRRVEVFAADGTHLRTIGSPGEGRGQFSSPRAMTFGPDGQLFVAQGNDFLIQYFDAGGNYVDTFGQGRSDETLFRIGGIAFGTDGRLYATRAANHYIQIFDAQRLLWLGDFGGLGRGPGEFNTPLDCLVRDQELYVVDQQNHRVQVFGLPTSRE
jgi:DNA-binding beta-propeller fold protein YncE